MNNNFGVPGWSLQEHLHPWALGTFGGWLRILYGHSLLLVNRNRTDLISSKCKGFMFDADPHGDIFFPEFEERELPKSFREFENDFKASLRAERG